jgi:hypothetical protein
MKSFSRCFFPPLLAFKLGVLQEILSHLRMVGYHLIYLAVFLTVVLIDRLLQTWNLLRRLLKIVSVILK